MSTFRPGSFQPGSTIDTTPGRAPCLLRSGRRSGWSTRLGRFLGYYQSVGTSPLGPGGFFARGDGNPSIATRLPTLDAFKRRYFDASLLNLCPGSEPEQVATYFNKGDLGIGREMHCIYRGCSRELACYVRNFGAVGIDVQTGKPVGIPFFDDIDKAAQAQQHNLPFATVAMVERTSLVDRGLRLGTGPLANSVFFVVYDGHDNLNKLGAQLDNKAFNTSIPGNCIQCHGINSTYSSDFTPFFRSQQVSNAMFLPFDLDAFEFFSDHPDDPSDPLSRAAQEPAFEAFNRMVLRSAIGRSSATQELIKAWYGSDLLAGPANHKFAGFAPPGWLGDPSLSELYRRFIAVGCRSCHISWVDANTLEPGSRTFHSASGFLREAQAARNDVCLSKPHRMPAAEQTVKVLWRSEGRQHLFAQLPTLVQPPAPTSGECGP